jgi:imidazoleglycerol-phosphate dehydratase
MQRRAKAGGGRGAVGGARARKVQATKPATSEPPVVSERKPGRGRAATVTRATRETKVDIQLRVDGTGTSRVSTGVPFLDHMLEIFARHGFFDLAVAGSGDLAVDAHHTVEDVGLTLGQAFREALGDKAGIRRFGEATVPLDEALVSVVVDLSGRPYLVYDVALPSSRIGTFDGDLVHDFLQAFMSQVGMNVHVTCHRGRNPHHIVEATFKGLARALDQATQREPRLRGVLSTKGVL